MSLLYGYNTNGFAHHGLDDALVGIAGAGFRSVGLTLDVHHAPPGATDYAALGQRIRELGLVPVVETGARFLLDADKKHWPTLLSDEGRERRVEVLVACVDAAAALGAPCISLWSGAPESGDPWKRLLDGLNPVLAHADRCAIDLAFEPEPGMFIETTEHFLELRRRLPHPRLRLTIDVGHVHCLDEGKPADILRAHADLLANVHLDDHVRGTHDHRMFGAGEMDFTPILKALEEIAADRDLPATVELSRHSHDAVNACRKSAAFLFAAR